MNFVPLKSGIFQMGDAHGQGFIEDHEAPPVMKKVLAFEIADTTVTNREFKAFIDATGYTTTAETIGDSYVFHLFVEPEKKSRVWTCIRLTLVASSARCLLESSNRARVFD